MTHYFTRVHTFWCDAPGCNQSIEDNGTAVVVWMFARDQGWRAYGGKHYCPEHEIQSRY